MESLGFKLATTRISPITPLLEGAYDIFDFKIDVAFSQTECNFALSEQKGATAA
jgi:hypothetical protein